MKKQMQRLIATLKELERERQYQGLKEYVRQLKHIHPKNEKQVYMEKGFSAYLKRLQLDRRARSLGLVEYVPFDDRGATLDTDCRSGDFRAWDKTATVFHGA